MQNQEQYCPICKATVANSGRYPKYICSQCSEKITDKSGEQICFANTELLGYGCQGYYKKNDKKYNSNFCYVNGIECYAKEAYFGGIVIEKIDQ